MIDPVCLSHGKPVSEHEGGLCLFCCICFEPLTVEECAVGADGVRWDVCAGRCAAQAGLSTGGTTR